MADAGYANGFEVTGVTLPEGDGSGFYPGLATAAQQWKQIGITVKLQPLEIAAWLDKNNKLDYDMLIGNRGFRGDPIEHRASRVAVDAERAWLREIGSGCDLPVGAHATVADDGTITLTAMLGTLDGRVLLRTRGRGDDPSELGSRVARELLDGAGGAALLSDLALEAPGP